MLGCPRPFIFHADETPSRERLGSPAIEKCRGFFLVFVIVEESQDLEKVSLQLNMKIVPSTYLVLELENAWHRCLPPIEYRALQ
jgi:hypothetical protein